MHKARFLVGLALLAVSIMPALPISAQSSKPDKEVVFDNTPLKNSKKVKMKGRAVGNDVCEFPVPKLELAPDKQAIATQQLSANFSDCSTVVEIGEPLDNQPGVTEQGGETSTLIDTPQNQQSNPGDISAQATTSSGYYRVWWEDVVNARVNEVKKSISWTWNGSCVTSASGSVDYWWLNESGWTQLSQGSWIDTYCAKSRSYADSPYENKPFCYPVTVQVIYDDVIAEGQANGTLVGYLTSTRQERFGYGTYCPSLHYHTELRRVTG